MKYGLVRLLLLTLFIAANAFAADDNARLEFANGLYARQMYKPAITEYEKFIRAEPKGSNLSSARYRLANSHYFLRNYKAAALQYTEFLKAYPKDSRAQTALFRHGICLYYLREADSAVRIFSQLSEQASHPTLRAGSLFYLGKTYFTQGKQDEGVKAFGKLMSEYRDSGYAAFAGLILGAHYEKESKPQEALAAYGITADRDEPRRPALEARLKIADIYLAQRKLPEAESAFARILEEGSGERRISSRALLGLFYCDYYGQSDEKMRVRLERHEDYIRESADRFHIWYVAAVLMAEKNDADYSINLLNRILEDPGVPPSFEGMALYRRAQVLSKAGKTEEALADLQRVIDGGYSRAGQAWLDKARLLTASGRLGEGMAAYDRAASAGQDVSSQKALYEWSHLRLEQGDADGALAGFEAYLEKYPAGEDAERCYLELIQIDLDRKDFESAAGRASAMVKAYPESEFSALAHYKWGVALTKLGRFEEAAVLFKKIAQDFNSSTLYAEALYGAGLSYEKAGQLNEALSFYEKLLEAQPNHPLSSEVLSRLGYLYIRAGDYAKAAAHYEKILGGEPGEARLSVNEGLWLMQYLLDQKEYDRLGRVVPAVRSRLKDDTMAHTFYFFEGESRRGLGDPEKALDFYTKALEAQPDGPFTPYAYVGAGLAYKALDQKERAEESFNEALRYDDELKTSARARFEIAKLRLEENKPSEAAKAFMLVAILFDDAEFCPEALYRAGEAFAGAGQTEESEKAFGELEERYPESPWAEMIRNEKES